METFKIITASLNFFCATPENFDTALNNHFEQMNVPVMEQKIQLSENVENTSWLYFSDRTGMGAIVTENEKLICIIYRFKDMFGMNTAEEIELYRKEKEI